MFWLFLSVLIVSRSQIGKAIADWIAGHQRSSVGSQDVDALERRVDERLMELEERVEFAERMLQRQRRSAGLPPLD